MKKIIFKIFTVIISALVIISLVTSCKGIERVKITVGLSEAAMNEYEYDMKIRNNGDTVLYLEQSYELGIVQEYKDKEWKALMMSDFYVAFCETTKRVEQININPHSNVTCSIDLRWYNGLKKGGKYRIALPVSESDGNYTIYYADLDY